MKIKRLIFLTLIIINCITIFHFSNQVADTSSNTSGRVVNFIITTFPQFKNMPENEKEQIAQEILQPIVRKLAHFSIYTSLGIWVMSFALTFNNTDLKRGIYSLIFGIAYATSDEIHQLFIEGRSCELRDVCIDSLGVLTGIVIVMIIVTIFRKIKQKGMLEEKSNIN